MTSDKYELYERYGYLEEAYNLQQGRRQKRRARPQAARPDPAEARAQLTDFNDNLDDFVPSYAARLDPLHHERQWIINSLGSFYRDGVIGDVTRIVKGGKEANVYCCRAASDSGRELIAAKLYRPRMLRHLRNDALYKEGRVTLDAEGAEIRNGRAVRALRKKTRFGRQLDLMSWIGHEYGVQKELHEAGADVPEPLGYRGNTILMAFVGDEWSPAPTLTEVRLPEDEAAPLFRRVMDNVRLMLAHHYVHGDLSAYNILYWQGQITIIDFPQLVDARINRNARSLLERDVRRVCEHFAGYGVTADANGLAAELWRGYMLEPMITASSR
jgi:RIO kinase 1